MSKKTVSKEQQKWNSLKIGDHVFQIDHKLPRLHGGVKLIEVKVFHPEKRELYGLDWSKNGQPVQVLGKWYTEEGLKKTTGITVKLTNAEEAKQDHKDRKGEFDGKCGKSDCRTGMSATYYNRGSLKFYCPVCARKLNIANEAYFRHEDGQPMCILHVPDEVEEVPEVN